MSLWYQWPVSTSLFTPRSLLFSSLCGHVVVLVPRRSAAFDVVDEAEGRDNLARKIIIIRHTLPPSFPLYGRRTKEAIYRRWSSVFLFKEDPGMGIMGRQ